jgi:hypothetical protein
MFERAMGNLETLPALAGGAVGGVVTPSAQLGHEMLGGQAFTPEGKAAAKMFFGSATEAKKAGYNDKRDPFFELGEAEKKIINSELKKLTKL